MFFHIAKFFFFSHYFKERSVYVFAEHFPSAWVLCGFYNPSTVLRQSFDDIGENSSSFHRSYHTFDKGNLVLRQAVFLIQHLVCPRV